MTNKIVHWVFAILAFGIPVLISTHSPVLDITVSGILNAIYLYVSQKLNPTVSASRV